MSPNSHGSGSLLINGAFLPGLWTRMAGESSGVISCPVDVSTFAADRWRVRSTAPKGAEVRVGRSANVPPDTVAETSLEICGAAGVMVPVCVGQTIEAAEAPRYRRELRFAAWCLVEHPTLRECPVRLAAAQATQRDVFDGSTEPLPVGKSSVAPVGQWTRVEFVIDAAKARPHGMSVELELPPAFLCDPGARVYLAGASLWPAAELEPAPRPAALEMLLARRFFQRHDAQSINAIGRALVCNAHELHFQFVFPEMRAFPAVTLPQDNAVLTVFSPDGIPQVGFVYDVPYRSRGSAMIRATKWHHAMSDGFLAFRGYDGAILLEAEL